MASLRSSNSSIGSCIASSYKLKLLSVCTILHDHDVDGGKRGRKKIRTHTLSNYFFCHNQQRNDKNDSPKCSVWSCGQVMCYSTQGSNQVQLRLKRFFMLKMVKRFELILKLLDICTTCVDVVLNKCGF